MEESGRLAALQLELDTKAAAVRQLRDELASKDEELEFLREELHTKTEELEEVRICYFILVTKSSSGMFCRFGNDLSKVKIVNIIVLFVLSPYSVNSTLYYSLYSFSVCFHKDRGVGGG
jgi:hypothetical protein